METKKRVLVTGGSGFIGCYLVKALVEQNFTVLNLDLKPPLSGAHEDRWLKVDLLDLGPLHDAVLEFDPEVVVHLAARCDLRGKSVGDYQTNTEGTENLLKVLQGATSVKRAIFTSSMLVCRGGCHPASDLDYSPVTPYGKSKVIMEEKVRKYQPRYEWTIVRPTSIWGPGFSEPYRDFFELISKGKFFHIGRRGCTKTYGYIGNVSYQIGCLISAPACDINGRVFYLGDYSPTNIEEWADEIASEFGIVIKRMPLLVIRIAALIGDLFKFVGLSFPITSFRLKNMLTDNVVATEPLRKIAPVLPYERLVGVRRTIEWLQDQE